MLHDTSVHYPLFHTSIAPHAHFSFNR
ncbi:hypothetical protein JMJ77_0014675, partial [Colletotrichum scovillei]